MNFFARAVKAFRSAARRDWSIEPGQYHGYSFTSPVLSGVVVTPQSALSLSAFFCGVNVIATDCAKLPFSLYRESRSGGMKIAKNDPRHSLVRYRPNPLMNAMRYAQMQMGHVLGWGGHYSEIRRDGDGNPVALWPLHPGNINCSTDQKSGILYYEEVNSGRKFRPEDVIHIAGLGFDGLSGYSPATTGRQAIGLGIGAEQFGASLFGNGAKPGGVLKTAKKLSPQAAERLRQSFESIHGGSSNANRTAVLEDGLDWQEMQISPDKAQFLLTRQFQVLEIARLLNLPPHKLKDYSQAHLTNVEESNLDYTTGTLQGWLEAIEAEYEAKLLFEDERESFSFKHDMKALSRGNMAARSAYYATRFQLGSISANEIRTAEGENPYKEPNADKAFLQAQYVPLDKAGEAMVAGKPGPKPGVPKVDPQAEPGSSAGELA